MYLYFYTSIEEKDNRLYYNGFQTELYDNQTLAPLSTLSTLKHIPFSFSRKVSLFFHHFLGCLTPHSYRPHILPTNPFKSLIFQYSTYCPIICIAVPFKQNYLRNGFTCNFYRNYPGKAILGKWSRPLSRRPPLHHLCLHQAFGKAASVCQATGQYEDCISRQRLGNVQGGRPPKERA